ncbi:plasmid partitioning protein RepB C-terminal domain-containing protein [Paraburkholderia bryophila]|uniref:plasmid partitioning protein RepB C-terminal domain-containing protein n=1 Tax=Paraburkholderia bryophila TaxID=420952 RepID=UPI0027BA56ED|nr:plasmid partitioning protein RepB C-terminal domain-containing protein [Paraburkholderia bryophila]
MRCVQCARDPRDESQAGAQAGTCAATHRNQMYGRNLRRNGFDDQGPDGAPLGPGLCGAAASSGAYQDTEARSSTSHGATPMTQARPGRFICRSSKATGGLQSVPGLCEGAAALVAGLTLPRRTVAALEKMVPARQVAAVRTMVAVDNLSGDFARALLAATPANERTDDARGRQSHPDCANRLGRMERELAQMQVEAAEKRSRYEADLVYLALTASFVRNWMNNEVIVSWLESHHPRCAIALARLASKSDFAIEAARPMKLPYALSGGAAGARKKRGK